MKNLIKAAAALLLACASAYGQTVIADNFNVANVGSGFLLGEGVNSGITLSDTRLTGTAAPGLRYISRTARDVTSYYITSTSNGRLRANTGAQSGRVTLSADGTNPFDFGSALGIPFATAANPVMYDITISMDNNGTGTHRISLGLGTAEGAADTWDFGLQIYRAATADDFYTVARRVDTGSSGIGDRNDTIGTMAAGTAASEVSFLIRVTDAGAEASTFNSRVQVSLNDGAYDWFYDTNSDGLLTSGWRLDGAGRFFSLDLAANNSSFVTFDNFSVTLVPEPSVWALGLLAGLVGWVRRRR